MMRVIDLSLAVAIVGGAGAAALFPATVASADTAQDSCYPSCPPGDPQGGSTSPAAPTAAAGTSVNSSALAFTGADIEGMVVIGVSAVVSGGAVLAVSRRRRGASAQ